MDQLLTAADSGLRTLAGSSQAARPCPAPSGPHAPPALDAAERQLSGALMRVNHVGEVCAQALYQAQALSTRDPALRQHFEHAAREETDHLAWTQARLRDLGARTSVLNPVWYAGAFAIGLLAGRVGDRVSLGFVVETERQVEEHLQGHLDRLPANDAASRAIVHQMKADEAGHAAAAQAAGAVPLPAPVRWAMRAAARVMTATAHRL
ncbi:MAG: 2-octaprenyl-3-methyl-6-methoxy-1,4-benzoquinol hydroxylase [Methylibium sp. NZG]|nr:MAG: 2-octaprenyl-3-methyl-6-methoxy-1,4-benzoquinol hydroxylase [Methylibium sp. NZG]